MNPFRSRLAAWLCLALLFLTGITPAQGFVLCIEADGCLRIEVKQAGRGCGDCEGHEPEADEATSDPSTDPACLCVDYVVPGFSDEQAVTIASVDVQGRTSLRHAAELLFVPPMPATTNERGPPPRAARVAQTLAHIRSVILLV